MKILVVGDVVGTPGLNALSTGLKKVQEKVGADFTIVNGENAADGMGFSKRNLEQFNKENIDCITMGNHTWAKLEIFKVINDKKIVRPANLPKGVPGKGYRTYEKNGLTIGVINLLGRVSMGIMSENPFIVAKEAVEKLRGICDIIVADFHGEATAEKISFAKYFDGVIDIVVGTHTHVQTADNEVLDYKTGYITDLGMTGTNSGIIGMKKEVAYKRFLTTLPERYQSENDGDIFIRGCVFELEKRENSSDENIVRIKRNLQGEKLSKYYCKSATRVNYNVTKDEYLA